MGTTYTTYDDDFYTWTQETAALLRSGRFECIDMAHLAEAVEDMGKSEIREYVSRLAVIIGHLLKLIVQVERTPSNEKSWSVTVKAQRRQLASHLSENPGLKNPVIMNKALTNGWDDGFVLAIRETGLDPDLFPEACPFTMEQLLDEAWWP